MTNDQDPNSTEHTSGLGDQHAPMSRSSDDLHQHDDIERSIAKRQPLAVALRKMYWLAVLGRSSGELLQHSQRQVDPDIVVAPRHERQTNAPGAGAEVQ